MSSSVSVLPTIREMYVFEKENRDYNVVRKHHVPPTGPSCKKSITRKGHYLDDLIRGHSSPGPANPANMQHEWSLKNVHQCKASERKTYVDDVQRASVKRHVPASSSYEVLMPWPKKTPTLKNVADKINFVDTCQYESNQTPGPGSYVLSGYFRSTNQVKKFEPHQPLKGKQNAMADMNTYDPCPVAFDTFKGYEKIGKKVGKVSNNQGKEKQTQLKNKTTVPGPGTYRMINTWKGKDQLKTNELSYLNNLSKGPSPLVYYS